MTSLFSSFDLGIFSKSAAMLVILLISGAVASVNCVGVDRLVRMKILNLLVEFFNSLNNSNFSKSLSFYIVSVMSAVFLFNVSSIFPYIFPFTSQMSVVLGVSLFFWVSLMLISFSKNFKSQISHFIPEGSPLALSFVLMVIEVVSGIIRPITLSVRLVANILAGHLLVILLSMLVQNFYPAFLLLSGLNLVEMGVSLIQSYIFVTLLSLYYSEL